MLKYTYATLRTHLTEWIEGNGADADPRFLDALDEIIQNGEARLYSDLDLATLDTTGTTATVANNRTLTKPDNLISDELVLLADGTQLRKRSRAFVAAMNIGGATGTPKYYAELGQTQWSLAPIPTSIISVTVHGMYELASITDGQADATTTWVSTRLPEVLAKACEIAAAQFLKFWNLVDHCKQEYESRLDQARAITENQRRVNVGDIMGQRASVRESTAPDPAANP